MHLAWCSLLAAGRGSPEWRYAVKFGTAAGTEANEGWYRYLCAHNTRHAADQDGYEGKQWSVWNRKLFVAERPLLVAELDRRQSVQLQRIVTRLLRERLKREYLAPLLRRVPAAGGPVGHVVETDPLEAAAIVDRCVSSWRRRVPKFKRVRLHLGGVTSRIIEGALLVRVVDFVRQGAGPGAGPKQAPRPRPVDQDTRPPAEAA
jgi:hypothetical protein